MNTSSIANCLQMQAVAQGDQALTYTEVSESQEGQAKALYNFESRNINELSLRKVCY